MICYVPNILLASNPLKLNNPALAIFFCGSFGYDCSGRIFVQTNYVCFKISGSVTITNAQGCCKRQEGFIAARYHNLWPGKVSHKQNKIIIGRKSTQFFIVRVIAADNNFALIIRAKMTSVL